MGGLAKLRKDGFAFTVDLLGEASVNEEESDAYAAGYHEVLDALAEEQKKWPALSGNGPDNGMDWGSMPKVNISIKPSALYSRANPVALEDSVEGIYRRLAPLYQKTIDMGGFMCIDMEQLKYREITVELFKRLRSAPEFRHYPHLCLVQQAYLKDTEQAVRDLIAWARKEKLPIALRLVKGAYWDAETVFAKQCDWPVPVWTHKPESDLAHEKISRLILENHDIVYFACASHNVRSIAAVMEYARQLDVPEGRYEFQVLYGMAEPVRKGLRNVAGRVRLYCPYGKLIPGMAYLVRRLLENTANESFLRQSFADGAAVELLMENPAVTLERELAARQEKAPPNEEGPFPPFRNEPPVDFTIPEKRKAYAQGIAAVRAAEGRTLPLYIDGKDVVTETLLPTVNPADPGEVLAQVCQAGREEIDRALAGAKAVFPAWRDTPPLERAQYMHKAAAVARRRIYEMAALQTLEVGKPWEQAYGDVGEGIDFLEYYARDMLRLSVPRRMGRAPGEHNVLFYQPKGVAAVIAPWNFPSPLRWAWFRPQSSPATRWCSSLRPCPRPSATILWKSSRKWGSPPGSSTIAPVRAPSWATIWWNTRTSASSALPVRWTWACTSWKKAAKVQPGQRQVKRVIAEMGGKNATIVDDDADLDEAVSQVVYSAFGFQGQKCSACSRVIVLDAIYDTFVQRLALAAQSLRIGPAENPENFLGPLADASLQKNVLEYIEIAEAEGKTLVKRSDLPDKGAYVPLLIVEDVMPEHRIAQEEVFGPVLAVMRAKDFDEALELALSTRFALTGAVFSRSPENLAKAREKFRVGNLYLNKGSTGAMVGRQPFGGFNMSGVGSKTGGPDYLLQFMDPRCVTENTIRRGFTPIAEDDDWV